MTGYGQVMTGCDRFMIGYDRCVVGIPSKVASNIEGSKQ